MARCSRRPIRDREDGLLANTANKLVMKIPYFVVVGWAISPE